MLIGLVVFLLVEEEALFSDREVSDRIEDREMAAIEEQQLAAGEPKGRKRKRRKQNAPRGYLGVKVGRMVTEHPDWTDQQIADAVGCPRRSLYRLDEFTRLRAINKQHKERLPRSVAYRDSEGEWGVDVVSAEEAERYL